MERHRHYVMKWKENENGQRPAVAVHAAIFKLTTKDLTVAHIVN